MTNASAGRAHESPQHRRPRHVRRAAVLALCLVLGAALNVLVAWGCFRAPRRGLDQDLAIQPKPWPSWLPADWPPPAHAEVSWNSFITIVMTGTAEMVPGPATRRPTPACRLSEIRAGLPLRSMALFSGQDFRDQTPRPTGERWGSISRGVLTLPRQLANRAGVTMVPAQPIPLGFAINTLVYGGLLWLLASAPGIARRHRRRRRGRCEACGYPVGVSPVCTECGAALRAPDSGGAA